MDTDTGITTHGMTPEATQARIKFYDGSSDELALRAIRTVGELWEDPEDKQQALLCGITDALVDALLAIRLEIKAAGLRTTLTGGRE